MFVWFADLPVGREFLQWIRWVMGGLDDFLQSPSWADVRTEALGLKKGVKFSNYEIIAGAAGLITKTLIHKHLEFAC